MVSMTATQTVPQAQPVSVTAPSNLSPSRASDLMTCPLLFRYRSIDRLPRSSSPAAVRGTLVHAVLERLYELPPVERTPKRALNLLPAEWQRMQTEEPEVLSMFEDEAAQAKWLTEARALLRAYFELGIDDPTRLTAVQTEQQVSVTLDSGLTIRGIIDRVDTAPDGRVRVNDYKSGRAPGERFEDKALFQMRVYGLILWRLTGKVPAVLRLIYLGDKEVLSWQPTEADLLATERKLNALWALIVRQTERRDFRPRESKLCGWCEYQAHCPAKGGTLLPWPTTPAQPAAEVDEDKGRASVPGDL